MNVMDDMRRLWSRVVVRTLFEVAATLLGRGTIPLSNWLVTRASRRLAPRAAQECDLQWRADLYELPAWLQLRSAVSLFTSRDIALIQEPRSGVLAQAVDSPLPAVATQPIRRPTTPDAPVPAYDALTGLFNRRALTKRLDRSLAGFRPRRQGLSVLLVDIDDFSAINRELGRLAGDALLKELGRRLRTGLRGRGHIGRFGGDQFAVLLPNAAPATAMEIAERLRCACAFPLIANQGTFNISASLGMASIAPGLKGDDLWNHAKSALGEAKRGGRNCVRSFEPMAHCQPSAVA